MIVFGNRIKKPFLVQAPLKNIKCVVSLVSSKTKTKLLLLKRNFLFIIYIYYIQKYVDFFSIKYNCISLAWLWL